MYPNNFPEPPRPRRPLNQRRNLRPVFPQHSDPRYPILQHQDPLRRLAGHEPARLGPLLALRRHERLPRRHHEEIRYREVRVESSLPFLLG